MGSERFGAPMDTVGFLQRSLRLDTFVEGGTFTGATARAAAASFDRVYTIEKSPRMQEVARANLAGLGNVTLLAGDTREHLPGLAGRGRALYWLDAHWSGGATYGKGDECPLLEELRLIFAAGGECAILVDDARLFLAPPPQPHDPAEWPTLLQLAAAIPPGWELFVREDVIYVLPQSVVGAFRGYLQELATADIAREASPPWWRRLARRLLH